MATMATVATPSSPSAAVPSPAGHTDHPLPDPSVAEALPRPPRRLLSESPGWVAEVDVVVVGSGIAGLTAALECRDLGRVLVVTKDVVSAGSTHWAQGGIASVQAI